MDRRRISALAHGDHPIAAPLDDATVARLLARAMPGGDECVLDLGCGEGHWLLRAAAGRPLVRGEGVDLDAAAIDRGRHAVAKAGLAGRLALHTGDAAAFAPARPADLVLNIGAAHAFGGLLPTLGAARRHLAPGGAVLVGDGFWAREPDGATLAVGFTADEFADLATTVERVAAAGWTPVYGHVSSAAEWDDYEWSWCGTLAREALDHPGSPDAADALRAAAEHRTGWLRGYRGVLGFVTLLLRRTP